MSSSIVVERSLLNSRHICDCMEYVVTCFSIDFKYNFECFVLNNLNYMIRADGKVNVSADPIYRGNFGTKI
ncbi:hypothetical protein BpHYR1_053808 [Brachionus plicatilis]|uniref:Uncharacterized protein n=1 Tax=Brachionus plicatilis TaxID=10195 RepID=A0A3M7TBA8_BRAPC|nr:hypothetical protein BpHYR1_053808 [Brachionus plicatilis]